MFNPLLFISSPPSSSLIIIPIQSFMASSRFALRNLLRSSSSAARFLHSNQRWTNPLLLRRLSSAAAETEVAVTEGGKKSKPRRGGRRSLWRNTNRESVPTLSEFFPSGIGNALIQATESINRAMQSLSSPSHLLRGRAKEEDSCYKLRYPMPGLGKEDVKVTVEDGVLNIRGEHKEEAEDDGDGFWAAESSYGYYDAQVVLPEDVKAEEIAAEIKDGVLTIVIPKREGAKREVQEIRVK